MSNKNEIQARIDCIKALQTLAIEHDIMHHCPTIKYGGNGRIAELERQLK